MFLENQQIFVNGGAYGIGGRGYDKKIGCRFSQALIRFS
jgi:hypothetical protein